MKYDVIVIGGGPAGLMASTAAGIHGAKTLLLEKGNQLGRKLAISGGGRCNVTNMKEIDELIKNIPGNGRFLYSVFSIFNNRDIVKFFEDLGVPLKEEDDGRMFPVSNRAKTVVEALVNKVKAVGTEIRVNTPVKQILYKSESIIGVETLKGQTFYAPSVIVAVGGKSVPQTGSTGDGYVWAKEVGHTITELYPTEVPLTSSDPIILQRQCQGLSLRNVSLSVLRHDGKTIISHHGDLLFTHFGLSGPIALRCSQFVIKEQKRTGQKEVLVSIDLFPHQKLPHFIEKWWSTLKKHPKKTIKNALKSLLPERMIPIILQRANILPNILVAHLTKEQLKSVCQIAKSFTLLVNGTLPLEKAFVTGGGVHVKEIHPKTMESKLVKGLYFCGEILDVHGYTGGYNITAAMCTGYVAGKSAAERIKNQIVIS